MNEVTANSNVIEKKCETLERAQQQAGVEVANTGGFSIPVVVFRQGLRMHMTGALPISWVRSRLETRAAPTRGTLAEARSALNRPENPEHSRVIADYLKENHAGNYIIPPMTLNIQQSIHLYSVDYPSEIRPGYLVIPATAKLAITDGQHRRSGIVRALDELTEEEQLDFGQNALSVMVTCETDLKQIHQDFADCSRTKPLPPSMLAVYDRRNPANRLVIDLEERCELFSGRIDSTSKTLSKKSTYLFLANQVRQLVKELLTGSYALPDKDFDRRAHERVGNDQQYSEALSKFSDYINYLTRVIPIWNEIARLPPRGLEASQVPVKREQGLICLTATGLNLIGRIGYRMFALGQKKDDWRIYADRLGEIDWRREAPLWQNSIIQGNRILTMQGPLKNAVADVCEAIGLTGVSSSSVEAAATINTGL